MNWKNLLNAGRRKSSETSRTGGNQPASSDGEHRTPFERDFDRILFSTPVRRLADKTQVFPLEKHDSVRTRLTHSHEVSNLARSIGTRLVAQTDIFSDIEQPLRTVPPLLAAAGLAHDLGNPPFGHQGENAIRSWFKDRRESGIFTGIEQEKHTSDFLVFEGNAQMLRLLTKLQLKSDDYGLDLTYATLATLLKYPTSSWDSKAADKAKAPTSFGASVPSALSAKKPGFFASEEAIIAQIWEMTHLARKVREQPSGMPYQMASFTRA